MGDSKTPASGGRLPEHELVTRLVPDPGAPPVYALLGGYLGRSSEPGFCRLYLSPDLASYVEILESDIANVAEESGVQTVWVKPSAVLRVTRAVRREQADFLRGEISADFFRTPPAEQDPITLEELEPADAVPTRTAHTCVPATCTLAFSCLTQPVCT
jgi:hypothetical protein